MEYYGFSIGDALETLPHDVAYDQYLEMVEIAERVGIDGWFFAEHHNPPMHTLVPSPNLLVAIASRATSRIRLGVMVTVLPYHHPVRVAEEIRMLDVLSKGRLDIGFGRGAIQAEQTAYGVDRTTTAERLDAELDVVLELLTANKATFDSPWHKGEVAELRPGAVQLPHPPMWVAAVSTSSIARAARLGASVATQLLPLDVALEYRNEYREAWVSHHPDQAPARFSHGVTLAIGETRAEADKYARQLLVERSARFQRMVTDGAKPDDPAYAGHDRGSRDFVGADFDELIERGFLIYGSVDDAIEQMRPIVSSGIEALTVVPQFLGIDYQFAKRSLELFGSEVIPHVDPRPSVAVPSKPDAARPYKS